MDADSRRAREALAAAGCISAARDHRSSGFARDFGLFPAGVPCYESAHVEAAHQYDMRFGRPSSLAARLPPERDARRKTGTSAPDSAPQADLNTAMTEKARDYSETLFLPKTDFPMRAGLPQKEPEILARWRELDLYRPPARGRAGPAEVHPARRPALRQRQHPYRARAQQDPQGRGDALAADARLRLQLRAGLGLPRPADRVEDRGGELPRQGQAEARPLRSGRHDRVPARVPRLCASTGSTCSATSSGGSASRATGTIPTPR